MFNKLALKIGLLFFLVILIIEIILFYILYTNLVADRVEEVMGDLLARGIHTEMYWKKTIQPRHWNMLRLWSQNQILLW